LRAYTVAATAIALGVSKKWVDNILSHHRIPGVLQKRQGITRRVTPEALLKLELVGVLTSTLGLPILRALDLASRLIKEQGKGIDLPESPHVRLSADIPAIAAELDLRLEHALEISPNPRRGRPGRVRQSGTSSDAPLQPPGKNAQ
jgi:hypothetical protein